MNLRYEYIYREKGGGVAGPGVSHQESLDRSIQGDTGGAPAP